MNHALHMEASARSLAKHKAAHGPLNELLRGTEPILIWAAPEKRRGTRMAQIRHTQGTTHHREMLVTIGLSVPF